MTKTKFLQTTKMRIKFQEIEIGFIVSLGEENSYMTYTQEWVVMNMYADQHSTEKLPDFFFPNIFGSQLKQQVSGIKTSQMTDIY